VPPPKGGKIQLSPPKVIDFGTVGIGVPPPTKFLTVHDVGKGELDGGVGGLSLPFSLILPNGPLFALHHNQRKAFGVQFAPMTLGPAIPQNLLVASNDPAHPLLMVEVKGSGAGGQLEVSKLFNFGTVKIGTKKVKNFELENEGPGLLSGTLQQLLAPYQITSPLVFNNLGPEKNFTITIVFTPNSTTTAQQTLVITTNPPTPGVTDVTVKGKGKAAGGGR
jgi:hypothetical protein